MWDTFLYLYSGVGVISSISDCLVLKEHASLFEKIEVSGMQISQFSVQTAKHLRGKIHNFFKVYYLFSYITALIRDTRQIHFTTKMRKNLQRQTTGKFSGNAQSTNSLATQTNCVNQNQHNTRFKSWCVHYGIITLMKDNKMLKQLLYLI